MLILSLWCALMLRDVNSSWQPYRWIAQVDSYHNRYQFTLSCLASSSWSCQKLWKVLSSIFSGGGLACPTGCGFTGPSSWATGYGRQLLLGPRMEIQQLQNHQTSSHRDLCVLFEYQNAGKIIKYCCYGFGRMLFVHMMKKKKFWFSFIEHMIDIYNYLHSNYSIGTNHTGYKNIEDSA